MKVKMYFPKAGVVNGETVFPEGFNHVPEKSVFRWEKRGALRADDPRVEKEVRRKKALEAIVERAEEKPEGVLDGLEDKTLEELEEELGEIEDGNFEETLEPTEPEVVEKPKVVEGPKSGNKKSANKNKGSR